MRTSVNLKYDTKIIKPFRSAKIWMINVYRKQSTKYETVAMIQDKLVAKLSSNDHVRYHRNLSFP